jgi:hypothetical protein
LLRECVDFLAPHLAAAKLTGEVRKDLDIQSAREWFARILVLVIQHTVIDTEHGQS